MLKDIEKKVARQNLKYLDPKSKNKIESDSNFIKPERRRNSNNHLCIRESRNSRWRTKLLLTLYRPRYDSLEQKIWNFDQKLFLTQISHFYQKNQFDIIRHCETIGIHMDPLAEMGIAIWYSYGSYGRNG